MIRGRPIDFLGGGMDDLLKVKFFSQTCRDRIYIYFADI